MENIVCSCWAVWAAKSPIAYQLAVRDFNISLYPHITLRISFCEFFYTLLWPFSTHYATDRYSLSKWSGALLQGKFMSDCPYCNKMFSVLRLLCEILRYISLHVIPIFPIIQPQGKQAEQPHKCIPHPLLPPRETPLTFARMSRRVQQ
jgi:hypothetical protein